MRVARVEMTNWMRFAGDSTVDLSADVYGIVAERDENRRRSNWSGKTSFVEAVRFALYGVHRFQREDGWIHRDAPGGSVVVTLSDGTVVQRSRRRGQATKLFVSRGEEHATGEAAQGVLDRLVGLSREDFEVTCWFGQKQLARLVVARPVERFDLVSGWFGLEGLQRCEERTRGLLSDVSARAATAESVLASLRKQQAELTDSWLPVLGAMCEEAFQEEGEVRGAAFREAEEAVRRAHAAVTELEEASKAAEAHAEVVRLRAQGKLIAAELEGLRPDVALLPGAREKHEDLKAALVTAGAELKAKRVLATGKFSGACPVDGSVCPTKDAINARTTVNGQLFDAAQGAYDEACRAEARARHELEAGQAAQRKADGLAARLEEMRSRVRDLLPAAKRAEERPLDREERERRAVRLAAAYEAREAARRAVGELAAAAERWEQLRLTVDRVERELAQLRAREQTARAAHRIFGRQGAQKRIAEAALGEIEAGANRVLREAGIDLSLRVQWAREGSGLAAWCAECGAPFPASQKVKACERCRAERGPKVVERLDVELSDRSGAAEDLAGAALQLAAAAWLRRERGVSWSVAFIDEPFGALDEENRRSFAAHLLAMLRGSAGFEQAFIVAHHSDVIDGLPARLLVRAGEASSSVEVAS